MRLISGGIGLCVIAQSCVLWAAEPEVPLNDLSLEDLSNVKIYSASKKSEDPDTTPAAVFVITQDDIKQMGVTSWLESLRAVPGFEVAKMSSNIWMVTCRGFGEQFANKLLVLVDGRPIYSVITSGVWWDQENIPINDIKQIEVIRGPGATIWGANAVDGVINVITKSAQTSDGHITEDTASIAGGTNLGVAEYSHNQKIDDNEYIRISSRADYTGSNLSANNTSYDDAWGSGRVAARYDIDQDYKNYMSFTGSAFKGIENQVYNIPILSAPFVSVDNTESRFQGWYLTNNWQHGINDDVDFNLSSYLDYNNGNYYGFAYTTYTVGSDGQFDIKTSDRNDISTGAGYKYVASLVQDAPYIIYNPSNFQLGYGDVFIQDKYALIPKQFFITIGNKFEYNDFTHFTNEPSAKLTYILGNNTVWASVSKALRVPSADTQYITLDLVGTPQGYISRLGNTNFQSEELIAYETGIKSKINNSLYTEVSLYYDDYTDLRTFLPGSPVGNIIVPLNVANSGQAQEWGAEFLAKYHPAYSWSITAGYSISKSVFESDGNVTDTVFLNSQNSFPEQSFSIRTSKNITDAITFNTSLYYTEALPALDIKQDYKLDSNIIWRVEDGVELGLYGDNLLYASHVEYTAPLYGVETRVPRDAFVKLTLMF